MAVSTWPTLQLPHLTSKLGAGGEGPGEAEASETTWTKNPAFQIETIHEVRQKPDKIHSC
jgi:hypothetical protein